MPAAELLALLDCFTDPAILLTPDYRIIAANQAYRYYYRHADEDPRGAFCYAVSHGYDRPCDQAGETCPLQSSQASGQTQRVVHLHHTPLGGEYVDVETVPLRNNRGRIIYFLEMLRHIRLARPQTEKAVGLVGQAPSFNHMLNLVQRVAPTDTTVLLLGESGTGKELVAEAVHKASRRHQGPFVPVDCSGLSETLFESELFGYEKGAFTGAYGRKQGLVEAATGGTLFLDEIGDIPLNLQVKLLRVLETSSFRRVGGVEAIQANFRLVCATHRPLKRMIDEGGFRQDLYYRISAFPIHLPPLRERLEDLELLAETLLRRINPRQPLKLGRDALDCLAHYAFPGNIRELRNILERASLLCDGEQILPEHLPEQCLSASLNPSPPPETADYPPHDANQVLLPLEEVEKRYLRWASRTHSGDRRSLARALGVSERTLYRKLEEL